MPLSDAKVRALKPKVAPYKVSDGDGMYILVSPSGGKLWRLAYRHLGKQKTLAMGRYPELSLHDARQAREYARARIAGGADPSSHKKFEKRKRLLAASNTFQAVGDEWFEQNKDRWVESYASRLRSRLEDDLFAALGKRPIAEIEPLEVLDAIRKVEKRGAIEMAKRIMQMASAIFRYGVATARCRRDITTDLRGALRPARPPKHRNALAADQLPGFLGALEGYNGDIVTHLALKLTLLTFVRTSEIRFAQWSEFENLDSLEPLWRIPAERMKMRQPHLVPLASQALGILRRLHRITGKSQFLFPAPTKLGVISENTLIFAIYRMGYHGRATVHGFRTTASTVLNERQFNRDWIERQLAHADGTVRGIYNAAEWLPGRRKMMQWWANYLGGAEKKAGRLGAHSSSFFSSDTGTSVLRPTPDLMDILYQRD